MAERKLPESTTNLEPKAPDRPHAKPVARRIEGKETAGHKFRTLFLADDISDIGEYFLKDLVVPTIKDVFMNFMDALLWGNRRGPVSTYRDSGGRRRTPYDSISRGSSRVGTDRNRDVRDEPSGRKEFNLDNITVNTKEEADIVLTRMDEYIDEYGQVTVGYLFELLGESCPYTAEYYGWRNLDRASVRRVRNGYAIDLPRPVRIEK